VSGVPKVGTGGASVKSDLVVLVDSHAHLHFPDFDDDRPLVIERAKERGVTTIVDVGTDLATSKAAVRLAEQFDGIFASVGIHPHEASSVTKETIGELRKLAEHPKVVAIGEIGLDFYRDLSPRQQQMKAFDQQLALAVDLGLPVIVHNREATDEVLSALHGGPSSGVLHSYSAGVEHLEEVLDLGFYVGFSGPVTFTTAGRLRSAVQAVPDGRLLVETDCPYLTPVPHRGKRNEPAHVALVAGEVARLRRVSLHQVAETTTRNAWRVFGLP
jgi:TatD DNase family protein